MFIVSTATKRKRRSGIFLILSVIVILSIVAVSVLYYYGTLAQRVDRELTKGLAHYQEGTRLIFESTARISVIGKEVDADKRQGIREEIEKDIADAEEELAIALDNFKKMKELSYFNWERDTSELMRESTEEIVNVAAELYSLIDKTDDISAILSLVSDGASKFRMATNKSNKLVLMSNAGRHEEVKTEAPAVAALYIESKNMIGQAYLIDDKTELSAFLEQINAGEKLAANLLAMADDVADERFEEYGARRRESNTLIDQLTKTSESALVINPASWIDSQLEEFIRGLEGKVSDAEEIHKKALDLWSQKS